MAIPEFIKAEPLIVEGPLIDALQPTGRLPFNAKKVPIGDYVLVIQKVLETKSSNDDRMWVFICAIKRNPRFTYPYRCTLTAEGLFTLANLYDAIGKKITPKRLKLNPELLVGQEIGGSLIPDEYQLDRGRDASKIDAIFPASDVADEPDTRGAQATTSRSSSSRRGDVGPPDDLDTLDDTDTDGTTDEDLEELDLDEL